MIPTRGDKVSRLLIDKSLEKYGVDFEYVAEHQETGGVPWYQHYTLTEKEWEALYTWAIPMIRKNLKCSEKLAQELFDWHDLMYGLKIDRNVNNDTTNRNS